MLRLRHLVLALGFAGGLAAAQPAAVSPRPDGVAVTVYRDPSRSPAQRPNPRWLNGFALISETRQVSIPAGESEIRFEGVASGIVPQSAIVTGLPEGIVERNRDAYLLSPGTLLDRSLGERVHLRRTDAATGEVREQEAVIRSGAAGAVVLETDAGFEALRCTGIPETLLYDNVPAGLSARPTLSVRARSSRPVSATVTLSYLASGFDWQANYVAQLAPSGDRLHLFAWLTLASTDATSFVDASTQAVTGRLNREAVRIQPPEARRIALDCWPAGTTSDIPAIEMDGGESIVVTGSRIGRAAMAGAPPPPPPPPPAPAMVAEQEELGDLKLYRIPEPVTVASRSQKQVALLQQPEVRVRLVHRLRLHPGRGTGPLQAQRVLVARNTAEGGLGLPLPAGRLALFAESGGRQLLIGEGTVPDRAVGEEVEVALGPAPGVRGTLTPLAEPAGRRVWELRVTSDRAEPVRFEAELEGDGLAAEGGVRLGRRAGRALWAIDLPANGSAVLRFSRREPAAADAARPARRR